jgi:hypothetical protein
MWDPSFHQAWENEIHLWITHVVHESIPRLKRGQNMASARSLGRVCASSSCIDEELLGELNELLPELKLLD